MIMFKVKECSPGAEKWIPLGRKVGRQLVDLIKQTKSTSVSKWVRPEDGVSIFVAVHKSLDRWLVEMYLGADDWLGVFVRTHDSYYLLSSNFLDDGSTSDRYMAAQGLFKTKGFMTSPILERYPLAMLRKFVARRMWAAAWWVCNLYFSHINKPCAYLKSGWETETDGTRALVIDPTKIVSWNFWDFPTNELEQRPSHDTELITTAAGRFALSDFFVPWWLYNIPGSLDYLQSLALPNEVDYSTFLQKTATKEDVEGIFMSAAPAGETFFGAITNNESEFFTAVGASPFPDAPMSVDDFWRRPAFVGDPGQAFPPAGEGTLYTRLSNGRLFFPFVVNTELKTQAEADAAFLAGGGIRANGTYTPSNFHSGIAGPFDFEYWAIYRRWTCTENHALTPEYSISAFDGEAKHACFARTSLTTSFEYKARPYRRTVDGYEWLGPAVNIDQNHAGTQTLTLKSNPIVETATNPDIVFPHYHATSYADQLIHTGSHTFSRSLSLSLPTISAISFPQMTMSASTYNPIPQNLISTQFRDVRGLLYRLYANGAFEILDSTLSSEYADDIKFHDDRPVHVISGGSPEGVWNVSLPVPFVTYTQNSTWTAITTPAFPSPIVTSAYHHTVDTKFYYLDPSVAIHRSRWPVVFPPLQGSIREAVPYKRFLYHPYSGATLIAAYTAEELEQLTTGGWTIEDSYVEQYALWRLRYNWMLNSPEDRLPEESASAAKKRHLDAYVAHFNVMYSDGGLPLSALMNSFDGFVLIV